VTTGGVVEAVVDTGAGGNPVVGDTTRGEAETLSAAVVVDEATAGAGDGGDGTDAPPHPPTKNRPNVKPDVNVYRFTRISMTHERQGSLGLRGAETLRVGHGPGEGKSEGPSRLDGGDGPEENRATACGPVVSMKVTDPSTRANTDTSPGPPANNSATREFGSEKSQRRSRGAATVVL